MGRLGIPIAEVMIIFRSLINDPGCQFCTHRPVENQNVRILFCQLTGSFLYSQTDFRPAFHRNKFCFVFHHQFAKRLHGQRRVALVVHGHIFDRPSHNTTGGVDFLHRHFLDVHARPGPGRCHHADVSDHKRFTLWLRTGNGW